ncbi:MAG: hypothetical protein ACRYFU_16375 [Janthinobacterium lividum]
MEQSTGRNPGPARDAESHWLYSLAFGLLLLAFVGFVFSLPLFPMGDSGLHLYYSQIFRDLLLHKAPLYGHFYAIRHAVQPYSLHYYALIALSFFLPPELAEKVVVSVVLVTLAFGFRNLVRALSQRSPGVILLIFPFLLNWPLSMGALNYTFAIGLLLFALAAYEGLSFASKSTARLWQFAGLLLLLILAHPVPLLLLLCYIAIDLLLRWWQRRARSGQFTSMSVQVIAFSLTCVAFIFPLLIADKSTVGKSASDLRFHSWYISQIWLSLRLSMFYTTGVAGRIYNKAYLLSFPVSLCFVLASGFVSRLKHRAFTAFDRLAIFSFLFLIASMFAPGMVNGSAFFAYRLWLPCWLLGIASCSGALRGRNWNHAAAAFGIAFSVMTLVLAQHILRPIALRSAQMEHMPLPSGQLGIFVQSSAGNEGYPLSMHYPVYFWNAARAFAAHGDVLVNSAWMNLTIMPLKENGRSGLMRDYTDLSATDNPNTLSDYLVTHPEARATVLRSVNFIVFVDPDPTHPDPVALTRYTLGAFLADWQCEPTRDYVICRKKQASVPA